MKKQRVAVVGGGMAGLTAAYWLMRGGAEVSLFESGPTLGGRVQCRQVKGHPVEFGGFLIFPWYKEAHRLFQDLGIEERLTPTPDGEIVYFLDSEWKTPLRLKDIALSRSGQMILWIKSLLRILPKNPMALPDLHRFGGQTVGEYIRHALNGHQDLNVFETFFDTVSQAYCYGSINETKMAFMGPIARATNLEGDVDTTSFFSEGSMFPIDRILTALREGGATVHLETEVTGVHEKTLKTHKGEETFDAIIFAQTVSPALYSQILPEVSPDCRYTHYLAAAVEVPETPVLAGLSDWAALFYAPQPNRQVQLSSIINLPKFYHPALKNCFMVNVLLEGIDAETLSLADAKDLLQKEMARSFPRGSEMHLHELIHWKKTMPISQESFVQAVRDAQGKNGYYFAGDYLGAPSIETAVATGARAAEMVLKDFEG